MIAMDQTFCLSFTYTNVKIKAKHVQNAVQMILSGGGVMLLLVEK